jgi:hypothetical protein
MLAAVLPVVKFLFSFLMLGLFLFIWDSKLLAVLAFIATATVLFR